MAIGGRVASPSCNLRYELYPFYNNVTYVAQPPSLSPTSSDSDKNATSAKAKNGTKSSKLIVIIVPIVGSLVFIIILAFICIILKRRKKQRKFTANFNKEQMDALQSLQFSIGVIKVATENFADNNKLGEGGSGIVYKGKLPDGQEIAVKRFERDAVLGDVHFSNEILT
ncbi:Cysteine-rich receptor-like protein kinase 25 [Bienertia sinuspersici]